MEQRNEERDLENLATEFEFPKNYKIWITIFTGILSILIFSIYFYLIFCDPKYLDPEKFGLSSLLIFTLTLLLIVNLPWSKFGMRIKKIGMIELEEKVNGQAKNVSKDIADLQIIIDEIKTSNGLIEEKTELEDLLAKFLRCFKAWAFSPSRIRDWGSTKDGFYDLNNYSLEEIKTGLRRLLAKDIISTRISKKGNTLYRYNKR